MNIIKNENIIDIVMRTEDEEKLQKQKRRVDLVMHPERLQIIGVLTGKKLTSGL